MHVGPYDFFRFSPFGLKELLAQADLEVEILRYQGGVGTAVVQLVHNWVFSGLARLSRRGLWGALLAGLLLPLLLIWCTLNNLAALALDRLEIDTPRFSPTSGWSSGKPTVRGSRKCERGGKDRRRAGPGWLPCFPLAPFPAPWVGGG